MGKVKHNGRKYVVLNIIDWGGHNLFYAVESNYFKKFKAYLSCNNSVDSWNFLFGNYIRGDVLRIKDIPYAKYPERVKYLWQYTIPNTLFKVSNLVDKPIKEGGN